MKCPWKQKAALVNVLYNSALQCISLIIHHFVLEMLIIVHILARLNFSEQSEEAVDSPVAMETETQSPSPSHAGAAYSE